MVFTYFKCLSFSHFSKLEFGRGVYNQVLPLAIPDLFARLWLLRQQIGCLRNFFSIEGLTNVTLKWILCGSGCTYDDYIF